MLALQTVLDPLKTNDVKANKLVQQPLGKLQELLDMADGTGTNVAEKIRDVSDPVCSSACIHDGFPLSLSLSLSPTASGESWFVS